MAATVWVCVPSHQFNINEYLNKLQFISQNKWRMKIKFVFLLNTINFNHNSGISINYPKLETRWSIVISKLAPQSMHSVERARAWFAVNRFHFQTAMLLPSMRTRFNTKHHFSFGPVSVNRFHLCCQCICVHFICMRTGRTLLNHSQCAVLSSSISFVLFASPPRKQNANVAAELQEKLDSHTRHHKIENSFEKFF